MQKSFLIFLLFCLFSYFHSKGNHIFGGDLTYTHISGLTYKITLSLYGQCGSGTSNAFDSLPTAKPRIFIRNNNVDIANILLDIDPASIAEITPVCKQLLSYTQCTDPNSTIPGVKKFVYSKVYTLSSNLSGWQFIFDGDLGGTKAGRAISITNIQNVGNQFLYLEADLNNQSFPDNNSSTFTTIPTPFYCANKYGEYNPGAVDADNDSLFFELVPALFQGAPVTYVPGYSSTHPISVSGNNFSYNQQTGQMNFIPDIQQRSLVVNKVTEFRNGVAVGSVMREISTIVYGSCVNNPAVDTINQNQNSSNSPGNIINVCVGTNNIAFNANFSDPDGDTVTISYNGLPAGANINISNNNTPHPSFIFTWNTASVPVGLYNFYVTTVESNCPINNKRTQSFTIRIANPNIVKATILSHTNCFYKAKVRFDLVNGILPRVVTVTNGTGFTKIYYDSTGFFTDSFSVGNYHVVASFPGLPCLDGTDNFQIIDSGIYPFAPVLTEPPVYCVFDQAKQLQAVPAPGGTVHWYNINGSPLGSPPVTNPSYVHTILYLISQDVGVCHSIKDTVELIIADKPAITVINKTGTACIGDKILLQATGASTYIWLPADQILFDNNNQPYIRVIAPSSFQVIGINQFGCRDTASFNYTDILPCCNFSYPTAFTPNGDAKNDVWRPIMYGNEDTYKLLILNRWGQVVFSSEVSKEGWDGTFNGIPQEIGTYFYHLKAKCLTGQEEEHQGDFLLIR
jgi:gliding motility-associated-like protein